MAGPIKALEGGLFPSWERWRAAIKTPGSAIIVVVSPILSAVLTAHTFPPHDFGWIAWFGLVPFCLMIPGASWTFERYLGAFIASLAFYGIGPHFIDTFGEVLSVASPGQFRQLWLAATALGIWVWPLTSLLARRLHLGCGFPLTASFPIAWVVVEHSRHWFCLILVGNECPWLHLGYSQVEFGPILQVAALGGMGLVSLLICSVNAGLAVAVRSLLDRAWPDRREQAGLVFSTLGLLGAVYYGSGQLGPNASSVAFRVGLVPRATMIAHARSEAAILKRDLEAQGFRPNLLLYGENTVEHVTIPPLQSVIGRASSDQGPWEAILAEVSREVGIDLVVGTTRTTKTIDGDRRHVCAVLVDHKAGLVAWSDKSALVPFAESSPAWADHAWVRALLPVTDKNVDFTPSRRMGTFTIPVEAPPRAVRLGAAICYDVSSAGLFRDAAPRSDAFLVLGNEPVDPRRCTPSWLLNMARCRAVESHRAIARTAIGGTTCMVDRRGRIEVESPRRSAGPGDSMLVVTLPLSGEITLYHRLGDWPTHLGLALAAIGPISGRLGRNATGRFMI